MKRLLVSICAAMAILGAFSPALADSDKSESKEKNDKSAAFDRMRTLVGTWRGKDDDGQPATVKYDLMSGGTIITETLTPASHPSMLTVYHMDGDKLLCTHYCSRNNQPRMKLRKYDAKAGMLDFEFVDATNLSNHDEGHMHNLVLKNTDSDHLTQEWSWHENDQESPAIFNFERQK